MSNIFWYCENCGAVFGFEKKICGECASVRISRDVENGPDGVERISEDDVDEILTLMEKHHAGVYFATVN